MLDISILKTAIANNNPEEIAKIIKQYNLTMVDGKIKASEKVLKLFSEYWDKRQQVKKLKLNGSYGSLLATSCRFFDQRLGQSTTLTGRQVVKHMTAKVNEIITGEENYLGKSIAYNDTDSVYFSAYETLKPDIDAGLIPWTRESVIELYDQICDLVNDSFVGFMRKQFNCPEERGIVIKAGREVVASKALFITKKRYAALVYDKEGKRKDKDGKIGEIKITGLDIIRSDTPEFVQQFLARIIEMVLTGVGETDVLQYIIKFRSEFNERPGWEKGSPRRANNITNYREKEEMKGKITMPGHVRASINWNTLKEMHDDKYSAHIIDGSKVVVCKLKPNYTGFSSVAYPVDEPRLPQWFKDLPFDHGEMEDAIIDKKISNLIGVLNWDLLSTDQNVEVSSLFNF